MKLLKPKVRDFMKEVGGWLLATAVGLVIVLYPLQALVADSTMTQTKVTQAAITPQKALQLLKEGNTRFVQGNMLERNLMQQVKATGSGQFPFATIVGCIDSRASNELIFDQGIGDIFSARIAGNFVNDDIIGSLEFASRVAGSRLIVVLGHTECGAVKGACDDVVMGNLTQTLANIKPAVAAVTGHDSDRSSKNMAFVKTVTEKNVVLTVQRILERSPILRDMVNKGELAIVGAMYDVHTGKVTFM
mgnify:FL=1